MNKNLGELFRDARQYGRVRVSTMNDGDYYCSIEFNTIDHVQLEAKSSFDNKTPEDAVIGAIESAEKILDGVRKMAAEFSPTRLPA
jgi:uncharacterized protein YqfB (UPF0267 family)